MTMPSNSQETISPANEIDHWLTFNHFDDHIATYSNKTFGRLWWKKSYSEYYEYVKKKPKRIQKMETQILKVNNLPRYIIRPLASWFLNISTKQKLVNFYHAKELASKAKDHIVNQTQQSFTAIQIIVNKLTDNLNLKGIGKYVNKVALLIRGFINKQARQDNRAKNIKALDIAYERSNNKQDISPIISKDFYNEIASFLEKSKLEHILYLLKSRNILEGANTGFFVNPYDDNKYWKILLLLDSNNIEVRRATIFCIMLYTLKSIFKNFDEILENAIKSSQSITLSLHYHFSTLIPSLSMETFPAFLKYFPVPLKSITYKMKSAGNISYLEKFLPESVTSLKIVINDKVIYERDRIFTFYISEIVDNLPSHIKHLDLSEARIGCINKDELAPIFKRLPPTLSSLDISNNNLSKSSDESILKVLASLPSSLTGLNISEENVTEENKKKLDRLSFHAKLQITKNNLSLKNIVTNFMWKNMNPVLYKDTKQLTLTHNGKSETSEIPGDIGEFIESSKQNGFHN